MWEALAELSPVLRTPLVLRYFATGITSYARIAEVCGTPVGTVRSRLSQGRAKLATALAATADAPHGDAAQRLRASRAEVRELLAAAGPVHLMERRQDPYPQALAPLRPLALPLNERAGQIS